MRKQGFLPRHQIQVRTLEKKLNYPHDLLIDKTVLHITSPDVHIDYQKKRLVMYFLGLEIFRNELAGQQLL
ncbi:MAG: hypothetical protein CMQ40_05770 [Gammaproteobacteria bacterium]|nr:hypothetical protein [Gammaproteobacteria bacterium]